MSFKNRKLPMLKVKFCVYTALPAKSILMLPELEKQVVNKALAAQKGASNEDTRSLCI